MYENGRWPFPFNVRIQKNSCFRLFFFFYCYYYYYIDSPTKKARTLPSGGKTMDQFSGMPFTFIDFLPKKKNVSAVHCTKALQKLIDKLL